MDIDAIVPVFSEDSDRLWRTIDGLLRQDASLNRTIVIDDGSPTPLSLSDRLRARDEVELMRMPHSLDRAVRAMSEPDRLTPRSSCS